MLRLPATTRLAVLVFVLSLSAAGSFAAAVDPGKLPPAAASFDFDKDVRPLLEQHCVECHGAEKQKGKLRVDARDFLLKGGENGVDVLPGKSAESPLIHAV